MTNPKLPGAVRVVLGRAAIVGAVLIVGLPILHWWGMTALWVLAALGLLPW